MKRTLTSLVAAGALGASAMSGCSEQEQHTEALPTENVVEADIPQASESLTDIIEEPQWYENLPGIMGVTTTGSADAPYTLVHFAQTHYRQELPILMKKVSLHANLHDLKKRGLDISRYLENITLEEYDDVISSRDRLFEIMSNISTSQSNILRATSESKMHLDGMLVEGIPHEAEQYFRLSDFMNLFTDSLEDMYESVRLFDSQFRNLPKGEFTEQHLAYATHQIAQKYLEGIADTDIALRHLAKIHYDLRSNPDAHNERFDVHKAFTLLVSINEDDRSQAIEHMNKKPTALFTEFMARYSSVAESSTNLALLREGIDVLGAEGLEAYMGCMHLNTDYSIMDDEHIEACIVNRDHAIVDGLIQYREPGTYGLIHGASHKSVFEERAKAGDIFYIRLETN